MHFCALVETIYSWISPYGLVLMINQYHFIEFVGRVPSHPVGVHNTEHTTVSSCLFIQQEEEDTNSKKLTVGMQVVNSDLIIVSAKHMV